MEALNRVDGWLLTFDYRYSGVNHRARIWTPPLRALRDRVDTLVGVHFNSCLLNRYEDGNQGMAWHSDDEAELGPDSDRLGELRGHPQVRIPPPAHPPEVRDAAAPRPADRDAWPDAGPLATCVDEEHARHAAAREPDVPDHPGERVRSFGLPRKHCALPIGLAHHAAAVSLTSVLRTVMATPSNKVRIRRSVASTSSRSPASMACSRLIGMGTIDAMASMPMS